MFLTAVALFAPRAEADQTVDETALLRELESRMDRVAQFRFIRDEASKLGVKAYLFGGTASGFAHYVRWDMLRERGDESYLKEFFDYDFFSIYRSTQDLDVVVDGTPEQAAELSKRLQEKYPSLQGSKDSWEVRLLRSAVGDKRALLGDPDFNKQHSDSNSTGLIEITRSGEPIVRDLRNWASPTSRFLTDIAQAKITYYFSPEHETTARYLQGKNPPIFSVIRYLTKAFQFDLELRPEDVATIRKIIDAFDPSNPGRGVKLDKSDFEYWMHGNGTKLSNAKKLFQHAVDVERAWNVLEELGLRAKLMALASPPAIKTEDSLATLLKREPLRSRPLGTHGERARDMGIDLVAHETRTELSLESLTRSKRGVVNAFISRNGGAAENASYGDGFYVRVGSEGAVGSGLTIRFRLDPDARKGIDFKKFGDYLVILNKNALHVIPESIDANLGDWFKATRLIGKRNLGLLLRLGRRLETKWKAASPTERDTALMTIRNDLRAELYNMTAPEESATAIGNWLRQPLGIEFVEEALAFLKMPNVPFLDYEFLGNERWRNHPRFGELVTALVTSKGEDAGRLFFFEWFASMMKSPEAVSDPNWDRWMRTKPNEFRQAMAIGGVLSSEHAMKDPRWTSIVDHHIKAGHPLMDPVGKTEAFANSPKWEEWMKQLYEGKGFIIWAGFPLLSERAKSDSRYWQWVRQYGMKAYEHKGLTGFVNTIFNPHDPPKDPRFQDFAKWVLSLDDLEEQPKRRAEQTDLTWAKTRIMDLVLESPRLGDFAEIAIRNGSPHVLDSIGYTFLNSGKLNDRPDLVMEWLKRVPKKGSTQPRSAGVVFKRFKDHPAFKGVFPFTPVLVYALVERGWDLRDGRFQAPERTKPLLPFMRKPVNCPALFVK